MYADVRERYEGGAARLEEQVRQAAAAASRTHTQAAGRPATNQPGASTGNPYSQSLPYAQSSAPNQLSPSQGAAPTVYAPLSALGVTHSTPPNKRFLMLDVNGRTARILMEPELPYVNDDVEFFTLIHDKYLWIRNNSPPSFRHGTPLLMRRAVTWLHELSRETQKLLLRALKVLQMDWLVWSIGDIVFYIPTVANFVKVR
jgi:hypothetical protein